MMCSFKLKSQRITDRDGFREWETVLDDANYAPCEVAVVIVDMWDRHWSRGATERASLLADRINETVARAREKGMLIIHAPSDTMEFYQSTQARDRLFSVPLLACMPDLAAVGDFPQPVDASDGGSDTMDAYAPNTIVWTRQNEKIQIDQARDVICGNEGERLFSFLSHQKIKFLLYMGVHTNMCVLNRSFGIKNMLRWGMKTALVRDLTDAMYNPEMPPYVSHAEGTRLIVEYIEKKYCPTIGSEQI